HRVDLLAAAAEVPSLVTATIEPQIRYRLWSLAAAEHRSVRVDAPEWIVPPDADDPAAGAPLFPAMLAIDGHATRIASSLSSFSEQAHAGLQVIRVGDGQAQLLTLARAPDGLEIAFAPDSTRLLAWTSGAPIRSWTPPSEAAGWSASQLPHRGAPRISGNGRWLALVDGQRRTILDRSTGELVLDVRSDRAATG